METERVLRPWFKTQNPNFDVGVAATYPNALGINVADATGGGANLGLDLPPEEGEWIVVGYPGANQQLMRTCRAYFSGYSPASRGWGGIPQLLGSCWMAPGSSGGPWFTGEPPVLAGVTSESVQKQAYDHYISTLYFSSSNVGALIEGL